MTLEELLMRCEGGVITSTTFVLQILDHDGCGFRVDIQNSEYVKDDSEVLEFIVLGNTLTPVGEEPPKPHHDNEFQTKYITTDVNGNTWYEINGERYGISTGGRCMNGAGLALPVTDDTLLLRQKLAVLVSTEIKDSVGVSYQLVHFSQDPDDQAF